MAEEFLTNPVTSWNVEDLIEYLRANHLQLTGVKSELVQRVKDCFDTVWDSIPDRSMKKSKPQAKTPELPLSLFFLVGQSGDL